MKHICLSLLSFVICFSMLWWQQLPQQKNGALRVLNKLKSSSDFVQKYHHRKDFIESANSCDTECLSIKKDTRKRYFLAQKRKLLYAKKSLENYKQKQISRNELRLIAMKLILESHPDIHIISLRMFSELARDTKNLSLVLNAAKNWFASHSYRALLSYLKSYTKTKHRSIVDQFIAKSITTACHYCSLELAKNALAYIDDLNFALFAKVLEKLPKNNLKHKYLAASLLEYQRMQTGN